jgi:hypothetical protein
MNDQSAKKIHLTVGFDRQTAASDWRLALAGVGAFAPGYSTGINFMERVKPS